MASGKFNMVTTEAEFTRLESELSFLQVRSTMTLQETIRQVKAEICEDPKQIAHTRLESIAGAENPYSLMQVFGRGHLVTRNGATVYVTRCQAAEVVPRTHTNCTNEIRGRTDCCEDFAGQTVKKIQFLKIVVVLLSNYLKCVQ